MMRAALSAARAGRVASAAGRTAQGPQGRRFASGGGPHEMYHGFQVPKVDQNFKNLGEAMMSVMWFWIFYRSYHDGKAVLGLEHPWDAHGGHDDHGHGHGPPPDTTGREWSKEGVGVLPVLGDA